MSHNHRRRTCEAGHGAQPGRLRPTRPGPSAPRAPPGSRAAPTAFVTARVAAADPTPPTIWPSNTSRKPPTDHELARQRVAVPKASLPDGAGPLGGSLNRCVALVSRCGERLGDGDVTPVRCSRTRQPVQRKDVPPSSQMQNLLDASLLGLGAARGQQRQRVVEGYAVNSKVHWCLALSRQCNRLTRRIYQRQDHSGMANMT